MGHDAALGTRIETIVPHASRGEWPRVAVQGILGGLVTIVALGRWALDAGTQGAPRTLARSKERSL